MTNANAVWYPNEAELRKRVGLAMRDAEDKELLNTPTWQTEPPTEAGWYAVISLGGYRSVEHILKSGSPLLANFKRVDEFALWWPVPITMPEPPE